MKKSTKKFFATTAILTFFSLLERGLGFLYRIVLSRRLGEEALGVYQAALSVFGAFLTVGVGGIPVTVSRFVSKFKAEKTPLEERRALSSGILLAAIYSLSPTLLFLIFAPVLSPSILPDERCLPVLKILLVGNFFAAVFAALRGWFWGEKQFLPPTLFEVFEESAQVLAGALFLSADGSVPLIERVALANTLSYVSSCLLAFGYFFFKKGKLASPLPLAKPLFLAALPVGSTRLLSSLTSSAVAVVLPSSLVRAGLTQSEAMKQFGALTGMVLPVLFIPATLIGSLSVVISPSLSESFYKGEKGKLSHVAENALTAAILLAGGLIPLFFTLGEEIGELIFSSALAGTMIKNGCPILLPMTVAMLSTTILNSLGETKNTLRFFLFGATFQILCVLLLPPIAGGYAYLIGTGGSFAVSAICNLVALKKHCAPLRKFYARLSLICALVLPTSLFGQACKALLKPRLGALFACASVGVLLLAFTAIAYYAIFFRKNNYLRARKKGRERRSPSENRTKKTGFLVKTEKKTVFYRSYP